ncbi:hypothetical protein Nepgr_015519 [Nepenthes gracilis]|uniref:Kinesin-like protein n=1 Tax=Nepenthes gracilis TaxID=150966 RepID=A0AAD3XQR9_NEPGR|nr:hypothetical protein Nepgr_015519 [Nepenthes gracilis]
MNAMQKQVRRSSASVHHQRQYSDNFIDAPSKWLQPANLLQDYGLYGGGGGTQGSKWNRSLHRSMNAGSELSFDPSAPRNYSRSSSLHKSGDDSVSPNEYSPGLLDIHSFDTELIPEMPVRSLYDGASFHHPVRGRSLDDSEPYLSSNRSADTAHGLSENSLLKSFSSDKDRATPVAKIKVVVRKRPLNKKEMSRKEEDIISIELKTNALTVHETKFKVDLTEYMEKHEFVFDAVLDENVSNDVVYAETVEPIVPLIFQKTKATCFAYGQTGNGKTYTMQPLPLRACQDFLRLMYHTYRNQGFQLFVSFFEIYGGKLFDLLNDRRNLFMREDGKKQVCIVGLQEYKVSDVKTIRDLIERGNATRSTGTTGANEESSRSHAVLQLAIKRSADGSESKPPRAVGKLSFIDLAGSERGADTTDNDKQTRMEGAEINKSLLALKECIRALDNDQNHIPFRGSKLTEVLRDSFVGNSRTVMISCISPSSGSCEHTLNTLRYADRVKSLSKGGNSKRDPSSSTLNVRDSTAVLNVEDITTDVQNGRNRFGWPRELKRENPPLADIDPIPAGRADDNLPTSLYSGYYGLKGDQNDTIDDNFDCSENVFEQEKRPWMKKTELQTRQQDLAESNANTSSSDDDLNVLLKEEDDLVTAHRRQVEETIDIVREEMNLLAEAEQPGNQLDDYISKLNAILSQKATGILKLQKQLSHFKRRLNEHNVLVSSSEH